MIELKSWMIFKQVYQADSLEDAKKALESFKENWEDIYPNVVRKVYTNDKILTFYEFPKTIWRSIYSTNLIESSNKQLKRHVKRKEQFPNEDSLRRFLVSQFNDYNHKFSMRCHRGFEAAKADLIEMFESLA